MKKQKEKLTKLLIEASSRGFDIDDPTDRSEFVLWLLAHNVRVVDEENEDE